MKPIWGPDEESMQPSWTDSGRETGGEVGDRLMFFIYISQQNRGKTNWNHCKTVTEGEMERESARDHEPYRERESAGGRGHWVFMRSFTKLVFSTFPPHFNFSALFYSNYFHPHVRVCGDVCECVCKSFCLLVLYGSTRHCNSGYCNTDSLKTCPQTSLPLH